MSDEPVYIYGLRDPLDGIIRYIGRTAHPKVRLRTHVCANPWSKPTGDRSKQKIEWLQSLKDMGVKPHMVVLAVVSKDEAENSEREWISRGLNQGWPLLNTQTYISKAEAAERIRKWINAHQP